MGVDASDSEMSAVIARLSGIKSCQFACAAMSLDTCTAELQYFPEVTCGSESESAVLMGAFLQWKTPQQNTSNLTLIPMIMDC